MSIQVAVSFGEFLDKLSILEIKAERITDTAKLANVERELERLRTAWAEAGHPLELVSGGWRQLKRVNERLWEIEDAIREKERQQQFDAAFIELARAVYTTNDERAALKRRINETLGSELVEEKSYVEYRTGG